MAQSTIRKWSDGGRLPAFYTPGGHRRFRAAATSTRSSPARAGLTGRGRAARARRRRRRAPARDHPRQPRDGGATPCGRRPTPRRVSRRSTTEPPDLILLDVMMPEVDGWEMLRRVQERHGVGDDPGDHVQRQAGQGERQPSERGAQAFIGKPFDPQQLIDATKQLLRVVDLVRAATATSSCGWSSTASTPLDWLFVSRSPRPATPACSGSGWPLCWRSRRAARSSA